MKRLFLFLTVAAAVCCAACSDDPEVAESNLSLLEDNVTFDMFGGRSVLEITADSPWTVSCDDDCAAPTSPKVRTRRRSF